MGKDKKQNSKPRYSKVPDYSKKDAEPAPASREETLVSPESVEIRKAGSLIMPRKEFTKEPTEKLGARRVVNGVPEVYVHKVAALTAANERVIPKCSSSIPDGTTTMEGVEAIDGALATDSNPIALNEIEAITQPGHSIRLMQSRAGRELLCGDKVIAAELDRSPKWKLVCPVCGLYVVAGMDRRNNPVIVEYDVLADGSMEPLITNDR